MIFFLFPTRNRAFYALESGKSIVKFIRDGVTRHPIIVGDVYCVLGALIVRGGFIFFCTTHQEFPRRHMHEFHAVGEGEFV
jgi:hypothetical protein